LWKDEGDTSLAKWEEYVTEGDYSNYREIKLTLPEIEGDFYNEVHFPDRNLLAFMRVSDRDLRTEVPVSELTEEQKNPPKTKEILVLEEQLEYFDKKIEEEFEKSKKT